MKKYLIALITVTLLISVLALPVLAEESTTEAETAAAENTDALPNDVWTDLDGETPDEEQVFQSWLNSEPTTLDPTLASDNYALGAMVNLYEPLVLVRNSKDGATEYIPGGATWEISEDNTVYTFHLHDNKWWDGEPVSAENYAYSLRRAVAPETGAPYSYLLEPIKNAKKITAGEEGVTMDDLGVKVIDEKTLEVTLEAPTATALAMLSQSVTYPLRQDKVEEWGEKYGTDADKVMGCGPFKITEWTHNTSLSFEKADSYWNAANVYFTKISMPIMTEVPTIMSAFESGEIDTVSTAEAEWRERFDAREDMNSYEILQPSNNFFLFNTKDEVFSNVKVRRAFAAALDREDTNNVIWNGTNILARGWLTGGLYVGDIDYAKEAPNYIEQLNEEVPDPKALLAEGLTELGMEDKIDNLEVNLTFGVTSQWFRTFGEYLQQVWNGALGVKLNVEQVDWPIFSDRVSAGDYQIGFMGWGSELPEPNALMLIHTDGSPQVGDGWNNDEFNKLVSEAQVEPDQQKRFELYVQAEKILMDEAPVTPVVNFVTKYYQYNYLKGMDDNFFGNMGARQGFTAGRP